MYHAYVLAMQLKGSKVGKGRIICFYFFNLLINTRIPNDIMMEIKDKNVKILGL